MCKKSNLLRIVPLMYTCCLLRIFTFQLLHSIFSARPSVVRSGIPPSRQTPLKTNNSVNPPGSVSQRELIHISFILLTYGDGSVCLSVSNRAKVTKLFVSVTVTIDCFRIVGVISAGSRSTSPTRTGANRRPAPVSSTPSVMSSSRIGIGRPRQIGTREASPRRCKCPLSSALLHVKTFLSK